MMGLQRRPRKKRRGFLLLASEIGKNSIKINWAVITAQLLGRHELLQPSMPATLQLFGKPRRTFKHDRGWLQTATYTHVIGKAGPLKTAQIFYRLKS